MDQFDEDVQTKLAAWFRDLRCSPENSVPGSRDSSGTAGARGRSITGSEIPDLLPTDASTTPDDGLNTFQARLQGISSRLNEGPEEGFILTVYFDSETAGRLRERLSGPVGILATDDAEFYLTTVTVEPSTT